MTRVLMTADTVGGVWTYACELIGALAPLGVEVTLATMGTRPTAAQRKMIGDRAELVESSFALEWMPDPWREVDAAGDWLLELAARVAPDVVHSNGYAHAVLPFDAPVVCVAHSCACTWFRAVHDLPAPAAWDPYRARVAAGLDAADAVVAPTRAILEAVLDEYGVERAGHVIPNGRDADAWRPGAKEPFVLAAGRLWDPAKGLVDLEACAARVDWPIHVAGPSIGPNGDRAPELRGVRPIGELRPEALADWMGRASIFAHPARYEPFGLSVLEAALAGAALVVGKLDTLDETWGDSAVYVEPGDTDALAHALASLTRDPLRRRALATAARARAMALTPARMAASYHALYVELADAANQEVCA